MKSLDTTFLQYASNKLAETNRGVTGSYIITVCNNAAMEYNRKIPFAIYPNDSPNKRTMLLRNLQAFDAPEQFKIIKDICELSEISNTDIARDVLGKLYERCGEYAGKTPVPAKIVLPQPEDDTLQIILEDIEHNIKLGTPELCLDRLHTFSTKYIRRVCEKHNISTVDDKGKNQPLHSLVGMLTKAYKQNDCLDSDFALVALKNSISIFSAFNDIRNNRSFAHDNQVLNKIEAEYVIKVVSDTLLFIDNLEQIHEPPKNTDIDYDLPF